MAKNAWLKYLSAHMSAESKKHRSPGATVKALGVKYRKRRRSK
jgi:hypothetical protein